jgi:hypothetical protein
MIIQVEYQKFRGHAFRKAEFQTPGTDIPDWFANAWVKTGF